MTPTNTQMEKTEISQSCFFGHLNCWQKFKKQRISIIFWCAHLQLNEFSVLKVLNFHINIRKPCGTWLLGFLLSWLLVVGFLASWFLSFLASKIIGFLVYWFRSFLVSKFLGFEVSQFQRFTQFTQFAQISVPYSIVSRFCKRIFIIFRCPPFHYSKIFGFSNIWIFTK